MSDDNDGNVCLFCGREIIEQHDYDHCDHIYFDGKIGCDKCLNIVYVDGCNVLLCWGCHSRLSCYESHFDSESDDY